MIDGDGSELDLGLGDLVGFGQRALRPFHRRPARDGLDIGREPGLERHGIGAEAGADRGIHRIGDGRRGAEQEQPAMGRETVEPDRLDPLDIRPRPEKILNFSCRALNSSAAPGAGCKSPSASRPRPSGTGRGRPCRRDRAPALGKVSFRVFGDGERVPDLGHAMGEPRHQHRGGEQQQFLPRAGIGRSTGLSAKSSPAILHNNQPRKDHDE